MSPHPRIRYSQANSAPAARLALETFVVGLKLVLRLLRVASMSRTPKIEDIHRLRVSCRRAAVGVRLFKDLVPKSQREWWTRVLKEIRHSANDVRDQDVLAEQLGHADDDVAWLIDSSRTQRRLALQEFRQTSREFLKAHAVEDEISALETQLAVQAKEERNADASRWACDQLGKFERRFRKSGCRISHDASRLHQFRIRAKELRYALEILSPYWPADRLGTPLATLARLQDRLGSINDHRSASLRFRQWQNEATDSDQRDYLKANRRAERQLFRTERAELLDWWTPRRRRRLHRRMRRLTDFAR